MIHIDMGMLASCQNYQKMRLIDTPGYFGSGTNHTACSNALKSSTAFVFAIPYTQLGDTRDVAILDEILKVDPCKSWYCTKYKFVCSYMHCLQLILKLCELFSLFKILERGIQTFVKVDESISEHTVVQCIQICMLCPLSGNYHT